MRVDNHRAWCDRATERAKVVLKPGDKLRVQRCGPSYTTVRFTEWDGIWACSRTMSDIHAVNIMKVNGTPVDFTNGEPRPPIPTPVVREAPHVPALGDDEVPW